jgi:signal transduction histidine kinase
VTERKRAEETLIGAREAALENARIKDEFIANLSHELRTPLNAVIGFSEIVSSELYGPLGAPQYKEYAELIRQSGYKLLKLVNQVVDIAKLEGHAMELDLEPEPLDNALDDALSTLRQEIEARGLTIAIEDEGRLPTVMADSRGLRTMLVNLLQNAIFYSPQGGVVTVRALKGERRVELEITDQGPGVCPDDIPRLMRPFEQGEDALTRSAQGAGLGLPIVSLLSQAMGGSLRLLSERGHGLTAVISLPCA